MSRRVTARHKTTAFMVMIRPFYFLVSVPLQLHSNKAEPLLGFGWGTRTAIYRYRVLLHPRVLSIAQYNFVSLEDADFTVWSSRDDAVWHVRRPVQCGELRAAWSRSVYCRPRQPAAPLASATAPTRRVVSIYLQHGHWATIHTSRWAKAMIHNANIAGPWTTMMQK